MGSHLGITWSFCNFLFVSEKWRIGILLFAGVALMRKFCKINWLLKRRSLFSFINVTHGSEFSKVTSTILSDQTGKTNISLIWICRNSRPEKIINKISASSKFRISPLRSSKNPNFCKISKPIIISLSISATEILCRIIRWPVWNFASWIPKIGMGSQLAVAKSILFQDDYFDR